MTKISVFLWWHWGWKQARFCSDTENENRCVYVVTLKKKTGDFFVVTVKMKGSDFCRDTEDEKRWVLRWYWLTTWRWWGTGWSLWTGPWPQVLKNSSLQQQRAMSDSMQENNCKHKIWPLSASRVKVWVITDTWQLIHARQLLHVGSNLHQLDNGYMLDH